MFDYFSFKKMLSGLLIKLIHFIGFLSISIYGVYEIINGSIIRGILIIVVGNIFWRITCEGLIVIFSIHDRLASIDSKTFAGFDPRSQQY